MGAWGYSIFDNDSALDVLDRWNHWVESPNGSGYKKALDSFFSGWGDTIKYGDSITNNEVIALLGIHLEKNIDIPDKLKSAAVIAISLELEPQFLDSWGDPERRKQELMKLIERIGEKPRKIKKPLFYNDRVFQYKEMSTAKSSLLKLSRDLYKQNTVNLYNIPVKRIPKFLKTINRVVNYSLGEKDFNVSEKATKERLLMLAWYVGVGSGFTEKELEDLMDKVVKNNRVK